MVKILITGGAGYIGSHTTRMLINKGYDIVIVDNLSNGHQCNVPEKVSFYNQDLNDKKGLDEIFKIEQIDCVIHFAAFIEAGESMKHPSKFFNNNVVNSINLFDVMIKNSVKNIIFSSTAAVYGDPKYTPIDEEHPKQPTNYYGLTKLMTEQILQSYDHAYGLKYIALRYFNACGADDSAIIGEDHNPETHLIPLIIQTALKKREFIKIFGTDYKTEDGTCVRDYVHVNDLANAHILALEYIIKNNKSDVFNLGNGKGYSVKEIIDECKNITDVDFTVTEDVRREGDPPTLIADYKKAKEVLKWEPIYPIKKIIKTAWEWHRK